MAELTPMKKQYLEIKSQHPDCLLFFRLGDFYEMFDDDAKTAAAELNLTLTTRDRNKPPEQRTPMCGVPYHSSEAYISRLIAKGYKVAICEQTEDPAQAKGLVDREVIRVVTPGTLIEENMLEEGKNNFLAALYSGPQGAGLCLGDISTGEVFLTQFDPAGWQEHAINELARFSPREIILSPGACEEGLLDYLSAKLSCRVEHASEARFDLAAAQARVTQQFTVGLDQVPGDARPAIQGAGGLLSYLYETQKTDLSYLHTIRYYSTGRFLELDPVARRNLELTETLRGKEKKGSLLWVLDKTKTAMGGRQLRSWLERPLLDPVAISRRLDAVGWLVDHSVEREELTQVLREITDLELSEDAVPTWTRLTEEYSSGYLTVPVVGAGTANTECEVLTGMSTKLFGPGEYPYQTRLMDRTVESVAYDLKENGYATHAIHNHRAAFYNRNSVYANLGFDDFTAIEYMPKAGRTPKNWAKDSILTDQIIKALDVTEDQSDLVFTVSVQGHGKYPTEQVLEDPAITVKSCPDEEYHYAMEYYVNQVHEMDQFVQTLTDELSQRDEKTVLVLYGDHLPALNLETSDMKAGTLYRTRYVIWDNFGLEKQDENLTAYQLSAAVLGRLGITNGVMNQYQQFCRDESTYWKGLWTLQYDVLYGQKYLYDGESPYEPTDMKMGMAPAYISPWILQVQENPGTMDVEDFNIRVIDTHKQILSDTE